jgi:hypothetical protein
MMMATHQLDLSCPISIPIFSDTLAVYHRAQSDTEKGDGVLRLKALSAFSSKNIVVNYRLLCSCCGKSSMLPKRKVSTDIS